MTVKELIGLLQTMPQDATAYVCVWSSEIDYELKKVSAVIDEIEDTPGAFRPVIIDYE